MNVLRKYHYLFFKFRKEAIKKLSELIENCWLRAYIFLIYGGLITSIILILMHNIIDEQTRRYALYLLGNEIIMYFATRLVPSKIKTHGDSYYYEFENNLWYLRVMENNNWTTLNTSNTNYLLRRKIGWFNYWIIIIHIALIVIGILI